MPWVRVRRQDSTRSSYKEERFYYRSSPTHVKFTLVGPSWAAYVSSVTLEGEAVDDTACDLLNVGGFEGGQRVLFWEANDPQVPCGAEGVVVGPTLGPARELGAPAALDPRELEFVRVRFFDSTWDLHYSCLELVQDIQNRDPSSYALVMKDGRQFEVLDSQALEAAEMRRDLLEELGEKEEGLAGNGEDVYPRAPKGFSGECCWTR